MKTLEGLGEFLTDSKNYFALCGRKIFKTYVVEN